VKLRWCLAPLVVVVLGALPAAAANRPTFQEVPAPEAYGQVVLHNPAAPAVVFDHWRHRAIFTCRLCHVDVGFAMQAGASEISRATNAAGLHCGACHDGKKKVNGETVFAACSESGPPNPSCGRCHSGEPGPARRRSYLAFAKNRPTYAGGYIDWEIVESTDFVKPLDHVEGVSMARAPLRNNKEIPIEARNTWVGDVIFSHKKHALWNGCEVCHPEIFPLGRAGGPRFTMREVEEGKYCGACHRSVAFPLAQCHRCHKALLGGPE
jgi:c(7)-type cytochrome triheme protein